ncbi:hypothetical protein H2198_005001 [Neophaeococcomyces mojaviensis]|uniref:Uncharacterized protein n=1 Tax=Neophaeococcomyces mojaviensis TaxID=3383035 RepID=A0ACC3A6S1_9EURO|nr:hypothetical protein H2198_005001 [Knufia sp. JES_112]
MSSPKTSSSRGSRKSSCESTFSRTSRQTYQTDLTSYSQQPSIKKNGSATSYKQTSLQKADSFYDEGLGRSSTSSIATYASTQASEEDLPSLSLNNFPQERQQCFDPDAIPTTPADFAELFPTTRRILIQHDDSTTDGNMNLRVDTDVTTKSGRRRKMTLFHLKMKDLAERQFSLRRYWRNSGREVASSKRQYVKPLPLSVARSPKAPAFKRPVPQRQDSGYHSEDDDDELEESLQAFTFANGIKATIPTNSVRLEFSNYAQVIVEPHVNGEKKQYDFEYWGEYYSWRKRAVRDGKEIINSYELINLQTLKKVASIVPDALSPEEVDFEAAQGAWIPASSMRLLQKDISDDLGDVIVATGLIALTDDCIPR